jgi:hypothetical protein
MYSQDPLTVASSMSMLPGLLCWKTSQSWGLLLIRPTPDHLQWKASQLSYSLRDPLSMYVVSEPLAGQRFYRARGFPLVEAA